MPVPSDRLALRSCRLFETTDLDQARDLISTVMQPHRLTLRERAPNLRSHMDFLPLKGLGIGTIAFGQGVIDVPPLDDYHLIIFCLSGSAVLRTDQGSFTIDPFNGVACAANRPLAGEFSADAEQFVVRIDRQRLAAFTGRPDTRLAASVDLRSAKLQPWLAALRALVSDPETIGLVRGNQDVAADYEQLLLRLLLNGQDAAPRREQARPASVHRAVAYLRAHAASPVALTDIAQAAGVAERTLNDAFQRFEGVSPMRYLRDLRLDRVRTGLQTASGRVTELALANGFTHLGRFSQDYADRFGELPSETLRRR